MDLNKHVPTYFVIIIDKYAGTFCTGSFTREYILVQLTVSNNSKLTFILPPFRTIARVLLKNHSPMPNLFSDTDFIFGGIRMSGGML